MMLKKLGNLVRRSRQLLGTSEMKQKLWDAEYSGGKWKLDKQTLADPVYEHLCRHAAGGRVLELGCGTGNTGEELPADSYSEYVGMDVSQVAVDWARGRSERSGRSAKNTYFQGDILQFEPSGMFTIVLMRESIYYIPIPKLRATLDRYARHLRQGGVFVVTLISGKSYRKIVELVESSYRVLAKAHPRSDDSLILVFEPSGVPSNPAEPLGRVAGRASGPAGGKAPE